MAKSILTKYTEYCIFCGSPVTKSQEHHFLFGNGTREIAEKDGIKGPACNTCHIMGGGTRQIHSNSMAEKLSKIAGQLAWEKHCVAGGHTEEQARELFRVRYGRSYL